MTSDRRVGGFSEDANEHECANASNVNAGDDLMSKGRGLGGGLYSIIIVNKEK